MGTAPWTPARRKALTGYVTDLAGRLGLADWDVRIDFDAPAADGTAATITPWPNQRRATLQLGSGFADDPAEDQRQTLVHELVHCHLFALHELVRATCERVLDAQAADVADVAVTCAVEAATDALATALATAMPAPAG